jgi:large conductance mechanosensitive channel
MGLIKEFREFAMRGNVVDLAVGVVIGAAFGKIVSSLVERIVMPVVGMITGGVDLSKYDIVLRERVVETVNGAVVEKSPAVTLGVGSFLTTVIDFVIIAFAIFLVIKAMNSFMRKQEAAPTPPSEEVLLLREIRDSLKSK